MILYRKTRSPIYAIYLFLIDDGVDCNILPRKKEGNTTTWGCSAAITRNDCSNNSRWWTACCIWSNETCMSKDYGKYPEKLQFFEIY